VSYDPSSGFSLTLEATLSRKWRGRTYSHFGESIGTLAQTQFFQEPSSATQAGDVEGACAGAAV